MSIIPQLTMMNATRWHAMHIRANRLPAFHATAVRLCAPSSKARYIAISKAVWQTEDRWPFVAVVHEREASGRFDRQLGQGDPLAHASVHVPKGRGPFLDHPGDCPGNDAFHRAALDALIDCEPHAARWIDWSIGGLLALLESYNGLGYAAHGVPSAYIWSGSDRYVSGKYVRDGVYDPTVVDEQEGCAPLLATMKAVDPSITLY